MHKGNFNYVSCKIDVALVCFWVKGNNLDSVCRYVIDVPSRCGMMQRTPHVQRS